MPEYTILKDSLLRDLKKIEWKEKILAEVE
jgi:hypothetical protein